VTLFDPAPYDPTEAEPEPIEPEPRNDGLACRAIGCTRPYDAHAVTLAAVNNAHHRPLPLPARKRKT